MTGSIPSTLGNLTSLTNLWLNNNQLTGSIPSELGDLTNLTQLYLNNNQLTGTIPPKLGDLTSLDRLWLYVNQLTGTIPSELGDLTNLTNLSLHNNQLTGTIPSALGDLTNLTRLSLYGNQLTGSLPSELGNLTSLTNLWLNNNQLTGSIPSELGDLTSLTQLYLNNNQLRGPIPSKLGDLTSLDRLWLYVNQLTGPIPSALGDLTNLTNLSLHRNQLTGPIPPTLGNLTNLTRLSLYENQLTGSLPSEWLGNLTSLTNLWLNDNQLTGPIPSELGDLTNLTQLYLNNNQLTGTIPSELGTFASLDRLYLYGNQLAGPIPTELGDLTNLTRLYLHRNQLTGPIPSALGDLTNLTRLSLYENQLTGPIPSELGQLASLVILWLNNNQLTGPIPSELGQLASLVILWLNNNQLTGPIPSELGDWPSLTDLTLWRNPSIGPIPAALIPAVNRGALAWFYDNADGARWTDNTNWVSSQSISTWFGVTTNANGEVTELNLDNNGLSGPVAPNGWLGLVKLERLSISGNRGLQGQLQKDLRGSNLNFLDVSGTNLCAPSDSGFQAWLASITYKGATCRPSPVKRAPVPRAPRSLKADGKDEAVVLSWKAPASGRSAITDYEYRIGVRGDWISIGSTQTTYTVTGLVNGTAYVFAVRAVSRIGAGRASNRAEAVTLAVLDFTHFANGTGITSDLVFVNVSPHPTRPALYFSDQGGALIDSASVVDLTGDLVVAEDGSLTVHTEMESLGQLTISTHGRGELVSGSVRVVSSVPISGLVRYSVPGIGVAAVGASPPVRDVLFPARRREGGIRTAAALHNLQEEVVGVNCRLMSGGVALEEVEIPLEANGQASWFIEEAFPTTDTSDFLGSVRCTVFGNRRFTAIAVETDAAKSIFTTLPVVPVDRTGGSDGETVLDFAHFANGTWITDLVFMNLSTQPSGPPPSPFHTAILPSRPAIYFYDTEGNPIAPTSVVDLTGDLEVTEDGALTVRTEMEPLEVLTISTHGRGELVTGSVRVVSDGPIGGMLRFDHLALGVAAVGASPPVSDVISPVRRREGGINTAVALHNLESTAGLVRCELMRERVLQDSVTIPLGANGQTSWTIDSAFTTADTSDFAGSVRCGAEGSGQFTAVVLEMDAVTGTFVALPLMPVEAGMPQE